MSHLGLDSLNLTSELQIILTDCSSDKTQVAQCIKNPLIFFLFLSSEPEESFLSTAESLG